MKKVLIIEDSATFAQLLTDAIKSELNFDVVWANSFSEAEKLLEENSSDFFISLIDMHLPDAPDGDALDLVMDHNIPSIVITGNYSEEMRKKCWEKMVIDYVIKEGFYNVEYILLLIKRIYKNKSLNVLVVDDSLVFRTYISNLLMVHQYNVITAGDGEEALLKLNENSEIAMIITDYYMPGMSGFDLLKKIRKKYRPDEVAVIGISSGGDDSLSARFIKYGANDFIKKPFIHEEFYCRVTQNINLLEKVKKIKDSANKDFLTGLYNRRYFFDAGKLLYSNAERENIEITVAMIDIDFFKKVNDTYGHDTGDLIIKQVAIKLKNRFRKSDIVSRFGGEEFCIIACNIDRKQVQKNFDELRMDIAENVVAVNENTIKVTVSIGISVNLQPLDDMIKKADEMLYEAKESGRNRVVIEE